METVVPDTNVVVRYLYTDNPRQSARAKELFESSRVLILESVLMETEWVLRAIYQVPRLQLAAAFRALLRLENSRFENPSRLSEVIAAYESGFDFADALHHANAEGLEVKTFDRKFVNRAKKEGWKVSAP